MSEPMTRLFGAGTASSQLAEWLAFQLKREWLYDHAEQRWNHWTGIRWAPDRQDAIHDRSAMLAAKALVPNSPLAPQSEPERRMLLELLKRGPRERALEDLAARAEYATDGSDWDSDPFLLGCKNGIVDLRENALVDPKPELRIAKSTGTKFVPVSGPDEFTTRAPRFMSFLLDVTSQQDFTPEPSLASFLLLWFGSSLFGIQPEQRFLLLTGTGRNGKGALKHAIMSALGPEYAYQPDANLYSRSAWGPARASDARADLISLRGKRVAFCSEPDRGKFNEEMLKAHTGGDIITARGLYQKFPQSWEPTHSITFLVNDAPGIDDVGVSMSARVMVADFLHRYDGVKEDKTLYDTLKGEREGILAVLCWCASQWYRDWKAGGGLSLPPRVVEASKAFIEKNDPVAEFLRDVCVEGPEEVCRGQAAYDAYRDWQTDNRPDEETHLSNVKFADQLYKRGFRKVHTETGARWQGFRPLRADELATRGDENES